MVIPVWDDYLEYLDQAIQSVIDDLPEAPIIVVDNASTPTVPPIDGAVVVRAHRRLSVGAARNLGMDHVKTRYVFILDVDDRVLPGTLSMLWNRMDNDPALAVCSALILDADTGKRHPNPRRFVPFLARRRWVFAILECVWSFVPIQGCALLRTNQVRAAGGYPDADWGDDWVLAVSLAFRGRVEITPHFGRYYRATPESVGTARGIRDDLASSRLVRERIIRDSGIGSWVLMMLPIIAVSQMAIACVARPALLMARTLRRTRGNRQVAAD